MNVLILTPDRVGSTLLQRLLTIYMLRRGFDKPVINLHELTNGLVRYFHTELNQYVLGKPNSSSWGYYQTLAKVQEILESVDHYKTSRLAQYHIVKRQDTIADQIKFYEFLNKNFFIIACRRENVLDHALSWVIQSYSKRLNVFSPIEKVDTFKEIYSNGIVASKDSLIHYLNRYKLYLEWTNTYFDVQDHFYYEQGIKDIEQYIFNLSFMRDKRDENTWADMFSQSWESYNAMHRLIPDLLLTNKEPDEERIAINPAFLQLTKYDYIRGSSWPEIRDANYVDMPMLPVDVQTEMSVTFGVDIKQFTTTWDVNVSHTTANFLRSNLHQYKDTTAQINQLVETGYLVSGVPIKLQSLKEKQAIIQNFNECVGWYNAWVEENNIGKPYTMDELRVIGDLEERILSTPLQALLK